MNASDCIIYPIKVILLSGNSLIIKIDKIEAKIITINEIIIIIEAIKSIEKIIYTIILIDLMIGSQIYFYTI